MAWTPPKEDKDTGVWTPPAGDRDVAAPTTSTTTPKYMSALRAIQDAVTSGFDDELTAALKSLPAALQGKYLDTYRQTVAEERASKAKALSDNPITSLAGQVVGGVVPGIGIGGALTKTAGAVTRDLPGMAQRMGAIGGIQGAAQGAGSAETMADIPREATIGGTVGGVTGMAFPYAGEAVAKVAGNNAVRRFVQNYKDLRPEVTGSLGPVSGGFGVGAVTPTISGTLGGPGIKPEDWSSDPYSSGLKSLEWGLYGALAGKGVKELGRVGGAAQKTMRGEGSSTGKVPGTGSGSGAGNVDPSGNLPGGPGGTTRTDDMQAWWKSRGGVLKEERASAPKAPEGMSPEDARKDAMNKQASATGRAETNSDSPVKNNLNITINNNAQKTTGIEPQSELDWPKIDTTILDEDEMVRKLKGEVIPSPANPWQKIVDKLEKSSSKSNTPSSLPPPGTMGMMGTEDDTFNALRRTPIEQVQRQIRDEWPAHSGPIIKRNGWSEEDFNIEILRREIADIENSLSQPDVTQKSLDIYGDILKRKKELLDSMTKGSGKAPPGVMGMSGTPYKASGTATEEESIDRLFSTLQKTDKEKFQEAGEFMRKFLSGDDTETYSKIINGMQKDGVAVSRPKNESDIFREGAARWEWLKKNGYL